MSNIYIDKIYLFKISLELVKPIKAYCSSDARGKLHASVLISRPIVNLSMFVVLIVGCVGFNN